MVRGPLVVWLLLAVSTGCRTDAATPREATPAPTPIGNTTDARPGPVAPAAPRISVEVRCTTYRPGDPAVVIPSDAATWDPILAACRHDAGVACPSGCCPVHCDPDPGRGADDTPVEVCVEGGQVMTVVVVYDDRCQG
jgi:hypothetical protein